jgi:hypothetical protein
MSPREPGMIRPDEDHFERRVGLRYMGSRIQMCRML